MRIYLEFSKWKKFDFIKCQIPYISLVFAKAELIHLLILTIESSQINK